MIRITVELVSARDANRDRLLGIAYIANTGRAHPSKPPGSDKYAYQVWLSKTMVGQTDKVWKSGRAAIADDRLIEDCMKGEVVEFDNVRRGAWDLLYLALKAIVGARNP